MTKQRDDLKPRPPRGMGPGLVLALLVHAALVVAIAFSVRWRASEPEGVEAELWAAVPQFAAPRAVEPQPLPEPQPEPKPEPPKPPPEPKPQPEPEPVPDAQIAIEKAKREEELREKKEREEAEKLAAEKRRQELEEKRKQDLAEKRKQEQEEKRKQELAEKRRQEQEDKRLAAAREANLKRILGQAGATSDNATGDAARTAGPSASYAGRIKASIKPNVSFPDTVAGNPAVEIEVRLGPDGTILSTRIVKPSGAKEWDDAVLRAIEKTAVLPRDVGGKVWSPMIIEYRPKDL
ncbi:cell envelope integrity protein TolA [Piscinibacter sp.]|uniref:cell envelope integrity protein TolA n=1 Tax=Piscinibacter sp. TaxID=1903157 RepID=UPI002BC49A8C|nr:cell envelope integrity protein TolA [Albitalea sp.]HUG23091.1 cell envelope integrity protein TolA [Albitalea sp.]